MEFFSISMLNGLSFMGQGGIAFEGTPAELRAHDEVRKKWLEV